MKITSPDFEANGFIPKKFTCKGEDINPALAIEGVPPAAKSLALVVDNPVAPGGMRVHWVVDKMALERAMQGHILDNAEIVGRYKK